MECDESERQIAAYGPSADGPQHRPGVGVANEYADVSSTLYHLSSLLNAHVVYSFQVGVVQKFTMISKQWLPCEISHTAKSLTVVHTDKIGSLITQHYATNTHSSYLLYT